MPLGYHLVSNCFLAEDVDVSSITWHKVRMDLSKFCVHKTAEPQDRLALLALQTHSLGQCTRETQVA